MKKFKPQIYFALGIWLSVVLCPISSHNKTAPCTHVIQKLIFGGTSAVVP